MLHIDKHQKSLHASSWLHLSYSSTIREFLTVAAHWTPRVRFSGASRWTDSIFFFFIRLPNVRIYNRKLVATRRVRTFLSVKVEREKAVSWRIWVNTRCSGARLRHWTRLRRSRPETRRKCRPTGESGEKRPKNYFPIQVRCQAILYGRQKNASVLFSSLFFTYTHFVFTFVLLLTPWPIVTDFFTFPSHLS